MKKENFIIYVSNIVILCFFLILISYLIFGTHWYSLLFVVSPIIFFSLWCKIKKNRLNFMLSMVALTSSCMIGISLVMGDLSPYPAIVFLVPAAICTAFNMGLDPTYPKPLLIRTVFTNTTQVFLMISILFIVFEYVIIGSILSLSTILISKKVAKLIYRMEHKNDVYMWSIL